MLDVFPLLGRSTWPDTPSGRTPCPRPLAHGLGARRPSSDRRISGVGQGVALDTPDSAGRQGAQPLALVVLARISWDFSRPDGNAGRESQSTTQSDVAGQASAARSRPRRVMTPPSVDAGASEGCTRLSKTGAISSGSARAIGSRSIGATERPATNWSSPRSSSSPAATAAATIGTPTIEGARVVAKIVNQFKAKKIIIQKFRRRKNMRRRNGHRQPYTVVQITSLAGLS